MHGLYFQEPQVAAQEAINYVSRQVRPGSTLVANERVTCCPYNALCQLKSFPSIISVETLMGLDLPGTRRVQENLGLVTEFLYYFSHFLQTFVLVQYYFHSGSNLVYYKVQ